MWGWARHFAGLGEIVLWLILAVIVVGLILTAWWLGRGEDGY